MVSWFLIASTWHWRRPVLWICRLLITVLSTGRPKLVRPSNEMPRCPFTIVSAGELVVHLEDGRTVSVPLEWFPKLRDATATQLADWRLIAQGIGIHWAQLDEDLSVRGLLMPHSQSRPLR